MIFRKNVFRLSIIMAMTVASANVLAEDFGVPADDNPWVPGIDANATLTELSTSYSAAGDVFDISAPPNDAGFLNGIQYGPVAFGGVPGGATGWVNSSYTIPAAGNYALAFWVSDVGDTIVESALAIDNVQLPGSAAIIDFSVLPTGWEVFGSGDASSVISGVSPTVGDTFAYIDTQNDGVFFGEGEVAIGDGIAPGLSGVDTGIFGGTIGSVLLTSGFSVTGGETVSFDANFLSNDGSSFNDFAVVQLFDMDTLVVTSGSGSTPVPGGIPADMLVFFAYDYLLATDPDFDSDAFDAFMASQMPADNSEPLWDDVLAQLVAQYSVDEVDLASYVEFEVGANLGGDGELPPTDPTFVEYDFVNAVTLYTADSADPLVGLDPFIPVMPDVLDPGNGIWTFPETPVVPDVTWWFDPEYATGYDYTVSGSEFTSIELPVGILGDNCYNLIVDGTVIHDCSTGDGLVGGTPHDLTDLGSLTALTITGIEVAAELDPTDANAFVTGFQFASAGNVIVTQAPIITFVPDASVPEPSSLFLMGAGILGFVGYRRKQAKA